MSNENLAAADYLKRLKSQLAGVRIKREPSAEFLKIHAEQQEQSGASEVNPEEFFDQYFSSLLGLIVEAVPESLQNELKKRIAVGCVDSDSLGAFIWRSEDHESYAIIFNRALLTMFNHYLKIVAAAQHPEDVVYCNGLEVGALKRRDYINLSVQMLGQFSDTLEPIGPELKLKLNSKAMSFVEEASGLSYLFVLAHEVSHFLNGDFNSASIWKPAVFGGISGDVFVDDVSHQMEFLADRTSFEIMMRVVSGRQPEFLVRRLMDLSVTMFFNFLREISDDESYSHPRSSERILRLVEHFLGPDAAAAMRKSFGDLSQISIYRKITSGLSVAKVLDTVSSSLTK